MKIKIDFGHPYFDEKAILKLTLDDLNCFYADANEVDRLNLFFVLEASLHRLLDGKKHAGCRPLRISDGVLSFYRIDTSRIL